MRRKILGAAATAVALLAGTVTPAHAGPWTAVCTIRITLDFRSPMRGPLSNGAYDLSVAGIADLDPTRPGGQACAATLAGEVTTDTWIDGSGYASVWSCGAALTDGTWHQTFGPEGPAGFTASHTIAGSWGDWTVQVANPSLSVVGAGEFTLQAFEATKTPACASGVIDSVSMVGTLVLQDP